jgi:hypothetical protein
MTHAEDGAGRGTRGALAGLIAALVRYAERPKNASDWQLRFQVQFLLATFQ